MNAHRLNYKETETQLVPTTDVATISLKTGGTSAGLLLAHNFPGSYTAFYVDLSFHVAESSSKRL
jgi:hypothetical protein